MNIKICLRFQTVFNFLWTGMKSSWDWFVWRLMTEIKMSNAILGLKVKEFGIDPTPQRDKHDPSNTAMVGTLTSGQEHTKVLQTQSCSFKRFMISLGGWGKGMEAAQLFLQMPSCFIKKIQSEHKLHFYNIYINYSSCCPVLFGVQNHFGSFQSFLFWWYFNSLLIFLHFSACLCLHQL